MNISQSVSVYYIAIWLSYLIFSPFYLISSGYPQPADIILLLGLLPALFAFFLTPNFKVPSVFFFGSLFVALTFMINISHFFFTPDKKFFLSSLYYIYNFGVFLFIISLFKKDPKKINHITYIGLGISIFLEFFIAVMGYGESIRSEGTFNNPNQLGYWSLLSFILLIIVKRDQKINIIDTFLIFAVFFTQIISLSKAGIVSMFFCLIILLSSKIVSNAQRLGVTFLIVLSIVYMMFSSGNFVKIFLSTDTVKAAYTRLSNIGTQRDDSLSGRGYDRIIDNPHYLLFGAGEGAHWRYNQQAKELHSGLATLIFSYGALGFILFFVFLYFVFRKRSWRHILLVIPIMLYGLTHQNIRFTYFWVVIASVYAGRYWDEKENMSLADYGDVREAPPG